MTGTEAISNGVSVFRKPQAANARTTLVIMSSILGAMFLGVSVLAALAHARPFSSGTPTVVSEIGKLVYGSSAAGSVLYGCLQAATAFILILAANTSFTGFPFLVSFVAEDSFLPRPLTVRGHRLVFSNGILVLAVASIALLLVTRPGIVAHSPVRHRGVHRFHDGRRGHDQAPSDPPRTRLAAQHRHQCHGGGGLPFGGPHFRHHRVHSGSMGRCRDHAHFDLRADEDQCRVPGGRRHSR